MNDKTCCNGANTPDASARLRRFRALCTLAELHGYREDCRAGRCRSARKCTGGPRGTFSRFAIPACLLREHLLLGAGEDAPNAIAGMLLKKKPPARPYKPSAHPWNEPLSTRSKPQNWPVRQHGRERGERHGREHDEGA